jgi:hypothetical protein
MSLLEDVAAQVRAVIADLGFLRAQLDTALHDIERAGQGFARVGRGTTTDHLPQAVAACAEAAERLVTAMGVIDQARELLWNYLLVIAPSLAGPKPAATPVTISLAALEHPDPHDDPPQPTPTAGGSPWGADDPADSEPPSHVQCAAAQLPDRRSDEDAYSRGERPQPTHGVVTNDDTDHAQLGGLLQSGRGPGTRTPGLRRDYRWGVGVDHHVESHVAAQMRADRRLRNLTLTINNPVCNPNQPAWRKGQIARHSDGRVQYRENTCDEQLPAMLPKGARLTVYVQQSGTVRKWKTYIGTGEGLTQP